MISINEDERTLTYFEKESLIDWWNTNCAEEYPIEWHGEIRSTWLNNLSWSEIDDIVKEYTNE